jgi:tetratricopeptide (TPR) repeat protein
MSNETDQRRQDDPHIGRTIGGFHLTGVLGKGGMGVVYRAAAADGRPAAVKLMLQAQFDGPEILLRFQREARIRIEHPNICQVLGAGTDEHGTPFIAFELLEGEGLDRRLERGPLSPAETVELGLQVCRGLAAAHDAGVIHRDLKPSNLFLCADGTVKLFDFGIALLWTGEQATRLTVAGTVIGTPSYLSPEQARGETVIDARTDVWSLGVLLYEALSGRRPFDRESVLATTVAVLVDPVTPLAACAPEVPPGLAAVVEHALAKSKAGRWRSALAFAEALETADLTPREETSAVGLDLRGSIVPGEQRVVAVLLADAVRNGAELERAVRERGGVYLPLLGNRAVGLFGGEAWEGDELPRAAAAALAARGCAGHLAVASGRAAAGGEGLSGMVLEAAEHGCRLGLAGIAVAGETVRGLSGGFALRPAAGGFWEIASERQAGWPLATHAEPAGNVLGRQAELLQLQLAVEGVRQDGRAVAVVVSGPPGIGKSRLREELQRLLEQAPSPVGLLAGRAEPLRRHNAYALLRSAFLGRARRGALLEGWPRLEPEAPAEERVAAVLALAREATGEEAAPDWAEALGELLGAPFQSAALAATIAPDPQWAADRLRLAVHDWFAAACDRGPVALLLEDLQWADTASLDLLEELLERLAERPLLVFVSARPELFESGRTLFEGRNVIRLQPRGLGPADVARLAQSLAGRALPENLLRAVAERSAGNPLFVREILFELRERGLLDESGSSLPLPISVEAAVQSRLDHLLPAEKDLCKRASIFGRPFTVAEVEALGAVDVAALLGSLGRKELLAWRSRSRGSTEREYQFRSSLVSDVAYGMLAPELRAELHRRAAAHLAQEPATDPAELGRHFELGGEPDAAGAAYARATLDDAARGDSAAAVLHAERSASLGLPADQRFAVHRAWAMALGYLGRRQEQERVLAAALAAATTDSERADALTHQAELLWRTGRLDAALEAADQAVTAARTARDPEALAQVRGWQVAVLVSAARLPEAAAALQEALAAAAHASPKTRAFVATRGAYVALLAGDLSGARDSFTTAARSFDKVGDVRRSSNAEANLADIYNRVGAYSQAEQALRAAIDGCRRVGNRITEGYAHCNLGYALTRQGRSTEARVAYSAASSVASATGDVRLAAAVAAYRAREELSEATPWDAADRAEAAAQEAERIGARGLCAVTLALAARARLAGGDPDGALPLSVRALMIRDALGGVEEDEAEIFLTHAAVLEACGRAGEATAVRERGAERLRISAARIGDPEWRRRFLTDVPANRELLASAGG